MVLSLLTSAMVSVSQHRDFGIIPENGLTTAKFSASLWLEHGARKP
jgi:hypothetical protein